jgi:hypothetical protein
MGRFVDAAVAVAPSSIVRSRWRLLDHTLAVRSRYTLGCGSSRRARGAAPRDALGRRHGDGRRAAVAIAIADHGRDACPRWSEAALMARRPSAMPASAVMIAPMPLK